MKLVHITTVPDSLYAFFDGQMRFMQAMGIEVAAVSADGAIIEELKAREGIAVFTVPMARKITPLQDLRSVYQLWCLLRRIKPDIVHAHTPKGGLLGMLAALLAGVPVRIYHLHGLPFVTATGWKRTILMTTERISCLIADRIFCVSRSIREFAITSRIARPEKMKTLQNGSINGIDCQKRFNPLRISPEERRRVRAGQGIPDGRLVVGFLGRITRDKGVADLAAAWATLRERRDDVDLLLVGPLEAQDPLPPEVIQKLSADPRVHFAGGLYDVPPFYAVMDLMVLPSYREGFGLAALEAAAMKVPVVATRIHGCVDAVQDGVTGLLVPPREPAALAAAIETYIDDPELRKKHGRAGRARAIASFDQESMWQALHAEYLDLAEQKGVPPSQPLRTGKWAEKMLNSSRP